MEIGRRIQTLRQMFNIKQGIDPSAIKAHPRTIGAPVQQEGANRGRSFDLETMIRDYWREIGWDDQTGIPTIETMRILGLEEQQTENGKLHG
jgi:aldehyde:ferredoxin oxidoreductase